jgi:hypothetical protein
VTNREAGDAMRRHHAMMAADLNRAVSQLGTTETWMIERDAIVAYLAQEILPHAEAEERTVYRAVGSDENHASFIAAMKFEHLVLRDLAQSLQVVEEPMAAVRLAGAVDRLFTTHAEKENRFILPVLEAAPEGTLGNLLAAMQSRLNVGQSSA